LLNIHLFLIILWISIFIHNLRPIRVVCKKRRIVPWLLTCILFLNGNSRFLTWLIFTTKCWSTLRILALTVKHFFECFKTNLRKCRIWNNFILIIQNITMQLYPRIINFYFSIALLTQTLHSNTIPSFIISKTNIFCRRFTWKRI